MTELVAEKVNLLNFNEAQMRDFFHTLGEQPYRARQVLQWIHHFGQICCSLFFDLRPLLKKLMHFRLKQNL